MRCDGRLERCETLARGMETFPRGIIAGHRRIGGGGTGHGARRGAETMGSRALRTAHWASATSRRCRDRCDVRSMPKRSVCTRNPSSVEAPLAARGLRQVWPLHTTRRRTGRGVMTHASHRRGTHRCFLAVGKETRSAWASARERACKEGGHQPTDISVINRRHDWLRLFQWIKEKRMQMEEKLLPTLAIGSHSNASLQLLPEAAAKRRLEAVSCTPWLSLADPATPCEMLGTEAVGLLRASACTILRAPGARYLAMPQVDEKRRRSR
jgi:hypothetical protein